MPKNALRGVCCDRKHDTIFILFNAKLLVFVVNVDSKHLIHLFSKSEKLLLIHFRSWSSWKLFHFQIPQSYFREDLLFFRIRLFKLFDQPRVVDLINWLRMAVIADWNFAKVLKWSRRRIVPIFQALPSVITLCKNSTTLHELMEIPLFIMKTFNQANFLCLANEFWSCLLSWFEW